MGQRDLEKYPDEFYLENFGETNTCIRCYQELPSFEFQAYRSNGKSKRWLIWNICRDCKRTEKRYSNEYLPGQHDKFYSDKMLESCGYDISRSEYSIHEQFKIRVFLNYGIML